MFDRGELKLTVSGIESAPAGPGSNRTLPVSELKNPEVTVNPPGSEGLLNVADNPPTVSVKVVEVPGVSVSKVNNVPALKNEPLNATHNAVRVIDQFDIRFLNYTLPRQTVVSGSKQAKMTAIVPYCAYARQSSRVRIRRESIPESHSVPALKPDNHNHDRASHTVRRKH
jgi:hypothetical protein